jgi:hypothetical protein
MDQTPTPDALQDEPPSNPDDVYDPPDRQTITLSGLEYWNLIDNLTEYERLEHEIATLQGADEWAECSDQFARQDEIATDIVDLLILRLGIH